MMGFADTLRDPARRLSRLQIAPGAEARALRWWGWRRGRADRTWWLRADPEAPGTSGRWTRSSTPAGWSQSAGRPPEDRWPGISRTWVAPNRV